MIILWSLGVISDPNNSVAYGESGPAYRPFPRTAHLVDGALPAEEGQFPFLASIGHRKWDNVMWRETWFHLCTGAIIGEDLIETAAHCVLQGLKR